MRISDWSSDVCSSDLQIAFAPALFAELVPWLALNRGGLTIFLHPETGDPLPDHRDHAIWLGDKAGLDLAALERSEERRVGEGCVSTCRPRWSPDHSKKKKVK